MTSLPSSSTSPPSPLMENSRHTVRPLVLKIRTVKYLNETYRIITQDSDGPCPLIALCNCLLLKGILTLPNDIQDVEEAILFDALLQLLLDKSNVNNEDTEDGENLEQKYLNIIKRLATGMSLNVGLTRVFDIEPTEESKIFGLLGIPLVHGWIVDPRDSETANAIGSISSMVLEHVIFLKEGKHFDVDVSAATTATLDVPSLSRSKGSLVDESLPPVPSKKGKGDREEEDAVRKAIEESSAEAMKPSAPKSGFKSDNAHTGGNLVAAATTATLGVPSPPLSSVDGRDPIYELKECILVTTPVEQAGKTLRVTPRQVQLLNTFWKNTNYDMVTVHGLNCLLDYIQDDHYCVFFWRWHFFTVFKHAGQLYALATDLYKIEGNGIVWEELKFVTNFSSASQVSLDINADMELEIYRQQQEFKQQQPPRHHHAQPPPPPPSIGSSRLIPGPQEFEQRQPPRHEAQPPLSTSELRPFNSVSKKDSTRKYPPQLLDGEASLRKTWRAADVDVNFNLMELNELNLSHMCKDIMEPAFRSMALELFMIFMCGINNVYNQKAKILLDDATMSLKNLENESLLVSGSKEAEAINKGVNDSSDANATVRPPSPKFAMPIHEEHANTTTSTSHSAKLRRSDRKKIAKKDPPKDDDDDEDYRKPARKKKKNFEKKSPFVSGSEEAEGINKVVNDSSDANATMGRPSPKSAFLQKNLENQSLLVSGSKEAGGINKVVNDSSDANATMRPPSPKSAMPIHEEHANTTTSTSHSAKLRRSERKKIAKKNPPKDDDDEDYRKPARKKKKNFEKKSPCVSGSKEAEGVKKVVNDSSDANATMRPPSPKSAFLQKNLENESFLVSGSKEAVGINQVVNDSSDANPTMRPPSPNFSWPMGEEHVDTTIATPQSVQKLPDRSEQTVIEKKIPELNIFKESRRRAEKKKVRWDRKIENSSSKKPTRIREKIYTDVPYPGLSGSKFLVKHKVSIASLMERPLLTLIDGLNPTYYYPNALMEITRAQPAHGSPSEARSSIAISLASKYESQEVNELSFDGGDAFSSQVDEGITSYTGRRPPSPDHDNVRREIISLFETPGSPEKQSFKTVTAEKDAMQAAAFFYKVCELATIDVLEVQQDMPYRDISISIKKEDAKAAAA